MKNKAKRVIALFVCALLVLTNIAVYANEDVIIDDASFGEVFEQTEVEAETLAQPQKLLFNKLVYGSNPSSNEVTGGMECASSNRDAVTIEKQPDGTWVAFDKYNIDSLGNYTTAPDGTDAYFVTKYERAKGTVPGYIYISLGDDITPDDKHFYIDLEVYGNTSANITLRYIISDSKGMKTIAKPRVQNNEWQHIVYEVNDAYFNGASSTGLADGKADFRFEIGGVDTYVKSVTVYNSADYQELYDAQDALELDNTQNIQEDFELPAIDGVDIEWSSSDEDVIEISGNDAIVFIGETQGEATLTAKIIKNGYYVEKEFDVTVAKQQAAPEAQKLMYNKLVYGSEPSKNTIIGDIMCVSQTRDAITIEKQSDGTWVEAEDYNQDSLGNYTKAPDGTDAYFVTKYQRKAGSVPGYVYIGLGEDVTPEDKHFYIDVEVFGNVSNNLTLRYVINDNKGTKAISTPRVKNNQWQHIVYEVTDAYFNGQNHTGLANGTYDFRFEAGNVDTYVKSVAVYNHAEYQALYQARDTLELEKTQGVDAAFELPQMDGFDIEWTSSDESAIYIEGGMAYVIPDCFKKQATLTAKIIHEGYYVEKSFDVSLIVLEKTAMEFGIPSVEVGEDAGTVTLDIENANNFEGDVYLYAVAKDKTTGRMTAFAYDVHSYGSSVSDTLSATVKLGANDEFSYYIDGEIGQALVNRKPSKVNNVAFSSGFDNAKITWTDAFDDYNFIKEYQVKVNDEVVYTTEDVFEYTLQNIKSGTQYKIEIVAIDHQELMSDYDTVMFTLPKHGYVNLGNYEKDRSGMELYSSFTNTSDTYIIEEFIDGVKCYRTASKKNDGEEYGVGKDYTFMYFRVDSDVVSSDNRKVMVEVTYYDTGKTSESVNIQYNAEDGSPAKIAKVAQITNSKTWKTATIVLEDAKFAKLTSLSKCDFRLVNSTGNSPIYISNVRVMAID